MSSPGAVSAAAGRGNRNSDAVAQEYQVILPPLPTGTTVLNTVFLHADVSARPYRLEHFREALVSATLFAEVVAMGAYQYNHVWAVTLKSAEGKKKLLAAGELFVKGRRCIVVDPSNQDTRLKLHWLVHHVPDDEVRVALAPYGKVTEVVRDQWRAAGVCSTTRSVSLRLKAGVTVDALPHQLRVAGDLVLVVVPGRAPLCLRCRGKGHIRRECRVPRCVLCRRFGHDESQCVRTYASVTGPLGNEDEAEHLMDVAESEAAACDEAGGPLPGATPPDRTAGDKKDFEGEGEQRLQPAEPVIGDTPSAEGTKTASSVPATTSCKKPEAMSVEVAGTSGAVAKRAREEGVDERPNSGEALPDEPPPKTAPVRRATVKPKPNIPPERRASVISPP
ncbi:uncharacterized protein LOC115308768 [Ixodes scapularis]|uniref:uncharacterized protein LOC115308768 n=1 Tax=Ixodes scapularis TaxID=6945 RepID=UPI001C38E20B|nr:uncharacterized protein LOC115308768 [Ixodes scapularis]